jgi:hypothetical protein
MKFGELRKTSATVDGTFNAGVFDLDSIYSNLAIDDEILEIKYDNKKKSREGVTECKTFNNQVTIKTRKNINIKLFKSKTFSASGAGNVDTALGNAKKEIEMILLKINKIKEVKKIKITRKRGFYSYNDKIITKNGDTFSCKDQIKDGNLTIDGKKCTEFEIIKGIYVDIKHKDKKKILYNNLAQEIGYIEYIMKRDTKSLRIKDCVYELLEDNEYSIKNSYGSILGIMKITIDKDPTPVELPEEVEMLFKASEESTALESIRFSNCNYNLKLKEIKTINRTMVCDYLESHDVAYIYNPSSYPGIKFSIGDTKITIFRTGSVLFSSKCDIKKEAYPFVIKMFNTNFEVEDQEDTNSEDTLLSIWDI